VSPPRGHKPCQQTCSSMGSSLQGSAGPGRSLLQHRLPTGSQLPSGILLLQRGVPTTGCRWRSAPPWTSMDRRGTTCLTMVFITSSKGRLSALAPPAPPPPSFFTDLGVCRVFFHIVSLLSLNCHLTTGFFFPFPFLNMLSQRCYQLAWTSPVAGLSWSWMALALSNMEEASGSVSQKPPL